MAQGIDWRAF